MAFAGFGAYMTANLAVRLGLPHIAAIPLAVLAVLPFALLLGLPAIRGWGRLPFTVLSMGLMVVASSLLWGPRADWFTGDGRLARPDWMNVLAGRPAVSFYLFALALAAGVVWFAGNLRRSRVGRALAAVRDSEEGAGSLGIDPAHYRLVALTFSAAVAALGGIVYAYLSGPIDPARFAAFLSIQYLLYTVVGGAGSLAGTAVVVFAFEVVPALDGQAPSSGFGSVLILGLLAMVVLRLVPGGLAGLARRVAAAVAPAPALAGAGLGRQPGFLGVPDDLEGLDDGEIGSDG